MRKGLLYFVAVDKPQVKKKLCEFLSATASREVYSGPGGGHGHIIADNALDTGLLYFKPDRQSWRISLSGDFYLCATEEAPGPQELKRAEQIAGHPVELADGNTYIIPCARKFPFGSSLPQKVIMGPNGELIKESLEKFAEFSGKVEMLWSDILRFMGLDATEQQLSQSEQWLLAAEALGLNYKLARDEINLLGLFTTENLESVFGAIVDMPTIMKVQQALDEKKNC